MSGPPRRIDDALIQSWSYVERSRPLAEYDWLLANDPVHWTESAGRETFWAITRHSDIVEITRQPELFSSEAGNVAIRTEEEARANRDPGAQFGAMRVIIAMDPPDHRTFRKVAAGYFSPRSIAKLHAVIAATAADVFGHLRAEKRDSFDFVEEVAERHPVRVLCSILGIPTEQEADLLYLADHLFDREDTSLTKEEQQLQQQELGRRAFEMFTAIINDRRANPRDDLATLLATAVLDDGEPMGMAETLGYYQVVFIAGHDTTKFALAGAAEAFADHPDQFRRLRDDPSLMKTAVEEVVRYIAPVNYAARTAMADCVVGETAIRRGDRLALFFGAANRDPDVFDQPERFDVGRTPNRHLGFGWAEHYCLGAHLARQSIEAVLTEMVGCIDHLERAGPATYSPSSLVHGHRTLPVSVTWAASTSRH